MAFTTKIGESDKDNQTDEDRKRYGPENDQRQEIS
jgi:hypothetical protein